MVDFIPRTKRLPTHDVPITPILDMMVCIIFFLLLSTTFVDLTQQTLPQFQIGAAGPESTLKPLAPQLSIKLNGQNIELILNWHGEQPGRLVKTLKLDQSQLQTGAYQQRLVAELQNLVRTLAQKFPGEKTLLLALSAELPYKLLIAAMDGVTASFPDVVLNNYSSVDTQLTD